MRRPLTNAALARALTRYPLMSQQVTGLIHWQAVKLAMKKVPFHRKPRFSPGEGSARRPPRPRPRPSAGARRPRSTRRLTPRPHRPPPPGAGAAPAARRDALAAHRRRPRLGLWALAHPARGRISVRLPDGRCAAAATRSTGPDVTVTVDSKNLWRRLATRGRLALGESYAAGDWRTDDLVGLLEILALTAELGRTRRRVGAHRRSSGAARTCRRAPTCPAPSATSSTTTTSATTSTRSSSTRRGPTRAPSSSARA